MDKEIEDLEKSIRYIKRRIAFLKKGTLNGNGEQKEEERSKKRSKQK